jgi:hypothetical protein
MLAGRGVDLLGVEPQRSAKDSSFWHKARALGLAHYGQRGQQTVKSSLLPLEPGVGFLDPVAQDQAILGQLVGYGQDSRFDTLVVGAGIS